MTLDEFYTKKSDLKAPEGLSFPDERIWFSTQISKLKKDLSKEDLQVVLTHEKNWMRKMNSSYPFDTLSPVIVY